TTPAPRSPPSFSPCPAFSLLPSALYRLASGPFADDIINNTVFLTLVGRHDVVAFCVLGDTLFGLAGVVYQNAIQPLAHSQDFPGCNINIGRLAGQTRHQGLVDHDS